jgi:hypothetical protein
VFGSGIATEAGMTRGEGVVGLGKGERELDSQGPKDNHESNQ